MQLAMIGLGRMGGNIVRRLMRGGHDCVVYDVDAQAIARLTAEGAIGAADIDVLVAQLRPPRTIWLMLPHGNITEDTIALLATKLSVDDVIIDGGNSFYQDDVRRAGQLAGMGIRYLDVGTSGGVSGLQRGYCMMIGGDKSTAEELDPIFATLAPGLGAIERTLNRDSHDARAEQGYLYCGPAGAGHFVKMIHNGIEYGMMQAMAEGFDIMSSVAKENIPANRRYQLNLADIAEVWRRGSVVSSWLLDLTAAALAKDATLAQYSGVVQDSGEGRWTVQAAIEEAVPAEVLTAALYARFRSRQDHTYAEKVLSAMRFMFGGHREPPVN
ncbi:MAG: decarboxylating 6-phosphogluconate dehydrogenase [Pseudomonadota bacterium]|nr:decarboxylating 6-phosphogluconate dehydrogenase [Pseudomonadota bacterium]